jgi:mannosyltransferase
LKPVLIHTHFHRRKTGVTRSIENVFPFFDEEFESYVYGFNIDGNHINTTKLKKKLFSDTQTVVVIEIMKF